MTGDPQIQAQDREMSTPFPAATPPETGSGRVKWYNPDIEYGFITFDDRTPATDIFVHGSAVRRTGRDALVPGDRYTFRIDRRRSDGRQFATHLVRVEG